MKISDGPKTNLIAGISKFISSFNDEDVYIYIDSLEWIDNQVMAKCYFQYNEHYSSEPFLLTQEQFQDEDYLFELSQNN